jgi:hypothetical protein
MLSKDAFYEVARCTPLLVDVDATISFSTELEGYISCVVKVYIQFAVTADTAIGVSEGEGYKCRTEEGVNVKRFCVFHTLKITRFWREVKGFGPAVTKRNVAPWVVVQMYYPPPRLNRSLSE